MAERPSPEEMKKRAQAAAQYAFMRDRPMSLADFAPEEEPPGVFAPESIEGPKIYDALRRGSLTPKGAPSVTAAVAEELIGGPVAQTVSKVVKAAPLVGAAAEGLGSMAGRAKELVKGALKGKAAPTAGAEADAYFAPEALKRARKQLDAYKSRETLVYLTPEQFLRMAEPLASGAAPYKAERVAKALDEGSKFTDVPFLQLGEGGRVKGHEGRHRAMALMERGVQRIPVRILSDNIRWSEQLPGPEGARKAFDYVENLPEEMIGQDGVSRIPFPFHREGPKRGQPLDMYRADASGSDVPSITRRTVEEKPTELAAEPDPLSAEALLADMDLREALEEVSLSPSARAEKLVRSGLKGKADEAVEGAATAGAKKADEAADVAQEVVRVPEVRAPNEAQRKALQGTSILDAEGQPRVLYHGTRQNFDEFDFSEGLGVHVGPAEAAVNRIGIKDAEDIYGARGRLSNLGRKKAPARVIPMYVNLKRPLRLTEEATGRAGEGGWSAASVIDRVMKKAETEGVPGISEAEIDDWYDDALSFGDVVFTDYYVTERELDTAVKEWLKSKGYDGIVYNNAFEGGGDSYLLFDKSQIVPAQTASK